MSKPQKKKKTGAKLPVWVWGLVIVAVVAVAAVLLLNREPAGSPGSPAEISVSEAYQKQEAGAFILDVREPSEWQEYHIPGATLIPLGELQSRVSELPQDQEIVVVCRSGNRSQVGRDTLLAAGFTQVSSMAGGVSEWRSAGYPTVSGD